MESSRWVGSYAIMSISSFSYGQSAVSFWDVALHSLCPSSFWLPPATGHAHWAKPVVFCGFWIIIGVVNIPLYDQQSGTWLGTTLLPLLFKINLFTFKGRGMKVMLFTVMKYYFFTFIICLPPKVPSSEKEITDLFQVPLEEIDG